jgi:hypothetical protein
MKYRRESSLHHPWGKKTISMKVTKNRKKMEKEDAEMAKKDASTHKK